MKTLLVGTNDIYGGAARAAYRLHQGLRSIEIDSHFLTYYKRSRDSQVYSSLHKANRLQRQTIKWAVKSDKMPLRFYPDRQGDYWSLNWFPSQIASQINGMQSDIVHLHWINDGFVPIQAVKNIQAPIIWTLHDSWLYTGGCHWTGGCVRFQDSCGNCPQLQSNREQDVSRWIWGKKDKHWRNLNLTIVTPSRWLAEHAKTSSLLRTQRIEVIPNGLDLQQFKPLQQNYSRELLNLPLDKKLILFLAVDATSVRVKGFHLLEATLQYMKTLDKIDDFELVVVGANQPENLPDLGFPVHYLGSIQSDTALVAIYNACDVFVSPSSQENLPNVIMEAMACGTPCVGFDVGGMAELIDHQENGYIAQPFDIEDFARGIQLITGHENYAKLSQNARQKTVREFELQKVARQYGSLYEEILKSV